MENSEIIEQKVKTILSIGEETIGKENLKNLLTHKKEVVAYDGFEPSGRMHLAQGLLRAHNVNKFINSGVKFKFWVADWFALMNLKLDGDIKKIQKAGQLMIETWKACGMNIDAVDSEGKPMIEFIWSSNEINKRSDEYWRLVLDIGTKFGLNRIKKCTQIMGRKEEDNMFDQILRLQTEVDELIASVTVPDCNNFNLSDKKNTIDNIFKVLLETNKEELAASQIFYPVMQCADVFFLGIDICSLGIDQRKVNMLALEYCDKIKRKNKPIIVSHHMIMGLDGSDKMSKSNPDNTVFMDDTEADVKRKINKAFCEPSNINKNPLLDWIKWVIIPIQGYIIIPGSKYGKEEGQIIEDKKYVDYDELEHDFESGVVFPSELKKGMINTINNLLAPVREHFANNKEANELLTLVKNYTKK